VYPEPDLTVDPLVVQGKAPMRRDPFQIAALCADAAAGDVTAAAMAVPVSSEPEGSPPPPVSATEAEGGGG
jgi:hypothetical protein